MLALAAMARRSISSGRAPVLHQGEVYGTEMHPVAYGSVMPDGPKHISWSEQSPDNAECSNEPEKCTKELLDRGVLKVVG